MTIFTHIWLFLLIHGLRIRTRYIKRSVPKQEKSILYLTAFFPGNSGYHWRAEKWVQALEEKGYHVEIKYALNDHEFYSLRERNVALFHVKFLRNRFKQVLYARNFETVIVRRDLLLFNDYGNLFLEKFLLKNNKNTILDFDDNIGYAKNEPRKIDSLFGKLLLENGKKFNDSLKLYDRFIVGNSFLKEMVLKANEKIDEKNILILPTCVDYDKYEAKNYKQIRNDIITLGWIGGNHNLFLLDKILPALNNVARNAKIELLVIAGKEYQPNCAHFPIKNLNWSLTKEVEYLKQIDIGLMPIGNTERDKGKCSFKLIQYMGLGIVPIATREGMNCEVIDESDFEGFLTDNSQWSETINQVLNQKDQWEEIGRNARKKIMNYYTFNSNFDRLFKFIDQQ